jgi:GT2 family glycosyltransferase
VSALVPTLGLSPWLVPALEALRREGGDGMEILVVFQGGEPGRTEPGAEVFRLADRVVRLGENLGFAAANNLALAQAQGEIVATVNDDVLVEEGWLEHLLAVLDARPEVAAVQGVNLCLADPGVIDGWGVGWNRWWQAVQLGHACPVSVAPTEVTEVFGVSATAALYRRSALEQVTGGGRGMFEEELFAYYEDVLLAVALRGAGLSALAVPAARARHAGSSSGRRLSWGCRQLIHGNRYLVLGRLFGRSFWRRLPGAAWRDVLDFGGSLARGEVRGAGGVLAGAFRAMSRGGAYVNPGEPPIPLEDLERFMVDRREAR